MNELPAEQKEVFVMNEIEGIPLKKLQRKTGQSSKYIVVEKAVCGIAPARQVECFKRRITKLLTNVV